MQQQALGPPEKSTQHPGPGTGDLEGDAERERRGGDRHRTAGETGHIDIPGENEMSTDK